MHSASLTGATDTHTKGQDMQPNTDHTRDNWQYWTSFKHNSRLPGDGPCDVWNMLEQISAF
jgi:hypothetical protein